MKGTQNLSELSMQFPVNPQLFQNKKELIKKTVLTQMLIFKNDINLYVHIYV